MDPECLKLAQLCSQAVDYPKNGIPVDMLVYRSYPSGNIVNVDPFRYDSPRWLIPYKPDWKKSEETSPRSTDYYESARALGELFRNVRLLEKDQMPSYDTNGNNSRPRPLSDNISQALKSYITDVLGQSGFYNKDADVAAMAPLFRGYVEELKYICLTHSLYDSPDSRLVEEEVVIGTILANCSQNRHRTDRMYRLRLNASVLVWDIRRRIYERTETPTAGELRYGLTQAWLAWDFGKRNKGIFGANSFTFIALAVIADILDTMGAVDVKRAGKRSNDEE